MEANAKARSQAIVPGSCGELVQGTMGGHAFHVTCPIDRYSRATAAIRGQAQVDVPDGLTKTAQAVNAALERLGAVQGVAVEIDSDIPHGKGMASSTADIAAAVAAAYMALERPLELEDVAYLAASIEPTDGVFCDGIVVFDHIEGRLIESLGEAPPIEIVVLEPPDTLDTIAFNRDRPALKGVDQQIVGEALDMAVEGIRSRNLRLIGEAATISASVNQKILYKPVLDDVIDACRRRGGLGVNVAHSGTVIGMLAERGFGTRLFDRISHHVPKTWRAYLVGMVDGGIYGDKPLVTAAGRSSTKYASL